MGSSSGLLPRAATALTALTALTVSAAALSIGCAHTPHGDAAVVETSAARRAAIEREGQLAWLQCREAALAEKAELLELLRRDVLAAEQSVRKLQEVTAENTALAERLKKAEVDLARARRDAEDASRKAPGAEWPADLTVRRVAPDARDVGYREALRTVQALVDSGQVKPVVRGGRVTFILPRQLDEADPYSAPAGRRELRSAEPPFEQ